jgi:hypothetical protein
MFPTPPIHLASIKRADTKLGRIPTPQYKPESDLLFTYRVVQSRSGTSSMLFGFFFEPQDALIFWLIDTDKTNSCSVMDMLAVCFGGHGKAVLNSTGCARDFEFQRKLDTFTNYYSK